MIINLVAFLYVLASYLDIGEISSSINNRGCTELLRQNPITRMVHQIEDNHTKISSYGRIRGSINDATPKELHKLHKLVKSEDKIEKTKKRGYKQTKLF